MAAALPPEGGSSPFPTIEELEEELQLQEVLLASMIESSHEDAHTGISKAEQTISDLKQRIAQARGPKQGNTSLTIFTPGPNC